MMINNFILDVKNKDNSNGVNIAHSQMFDCNHKSEVLDLSRRRDSVETRKTPSPYNSSSFEEGSPSTMHGSPPRNGPSTNISSSLHHPYTSSSASQYNRYSPPSYPMGYPNCPPKRETPSPSEMKVFTKHAPTVNNTTTTPTEEINPYMLQAIQRHINPPKRDSESPIPNHYYARSASTGRDDVSPYMMQAAAFQQQLNHPIIDSDESSESPSFNSALPYTTSVYPMVIGRDGKLTRPFKAYPRDPLSITASFTASDSLMDSQSAEKYQIFRKEMLKQIRAANGGQPTLSNPKMRRTSVKSQEQSASENSDTQNDSNNNNNPNSPTSCVKDNAYYERRRKNNAAAKKSRDRRRIKEDEIAIRANFLERENIELKFELAAARKQLQLYGVKT